MKLHHLYELNLALLITHEIDSAFWHEWELFRLPGGIRLFLFLNFLLVLAFVLGLRPVLLEQRRATAFSLALAGAGMLAVVLHGGFLAAGYEQFRSAMSLLILFAILVVSCAQIVVVNRRWEHPGEP